MKADLEAFLPIFTEEALHSSINHSWEIFEQKIEELMDKYIPSQLLSGNKTNKPWICKEIKSLHRKRLRLYNKQKSTGKSKDRHRYQQAKSTIQKLERQSYWKYIESLIDIGDPSKDQQPNKQKRFWSYIKSLRKDSRGVSPLKDKGKLHSDATDKANILNNQYSSVFTHENKSSISRPEGDPAPDMPDIHITLAGVEKLLRNINPQKASGPDLLQARVLKELSQECAPYLLVIYRKCLADGDIPYIWKTANISAVFKKGERFKASNYRPISLTCIACKMLEHIIVSNIMKLLDSNNILTDSQHGLRPRRSCETQLLTLTSELVSSLDRRRQHDLAILDFSKAFDRVPHSRLLTKLHHSGIKVRLFADDCIVYREIQSPQDCEALQEDLASLARWEKAWGMDFRPEKCSILRVHRKRETINYVYSLKGHTLTIDNQSKYLGVVISKDLS